MTSRRTKLISLKVMAERAKAYVAWVQFLMIGVIFIQQTSFDLITTLVLVAVLLGALSLIDFKWILPAELNRMAEKNPVMMSIKKDIAGIKARLKESD
jgi:Tfp pilus assembly protein PilZ